MKLTHNGGGTNRGLRALALGIVLTLGATACGGGGRDSGSSSSAADARKQAASALDAGLAAHSKGDLTRAAAEYDKTLRSDPDNKFASYNLALIDEASGNYGLAEQKYRAALKSDPKYQPALFNLAILRTSRDPKEATTLYERAVAANPQDAAALLNLGLLQRAAGQKAEGDRNVRRATTLNPKLKDPATK